MNPLNESFSFQVNLQGMISLLSEHLYSNPNTYIRELLQNAVDAITALRHLDNDLKGTIQITLPNTTNKLFVFEDNGIGLKESEIHQFLSVIGESSKRKDADDARDFIGKFGIGMLSCFVVSEKIIIETRSAYDDKGFRWTAFSDGNYEIEALTSSMPIGTKVYLTPKDKYAHLFSYAHFIPQIKYYGDALSEKIVILHESKQTILNEEQPQWLQKGSDKEALLQSGRELFNVPFLDAVPFETEAGKCQGVMYILPYKTQFSAKQNHRLYLKRMFLSDTDNSLLPPWAFFVRILMNSNELSATASRESFMQNDELRATRKEIGQILKEYLKSIRKVDQGIYFKIIQIHFLHLKAIAIEDAEFLELLADDLPFETNKGFRSFKHLTDETQTLYYASDYEDFKQLQRIAQSQGTLLINASYTFDEELLKKIARMRPQLKLEEMTPSRLLNSFISLDVEEEIKHLSFLNRVEETLKDFNCECQLKHFKPTDTTAIYTRPEENSHTATIRQVKQSSNPFAGALSSFGNTASKKATFCLNIDNQLVKNITSINDDFLFQSVIEVLYVQAIIMGKYTVSEKEMALFNEALNNLMVMGLTNFVNL